MNSIGAQGMTPDLQTTVAELEYEARLLRARNYLLRTRLHSQATADIDIVADEVKKWADEVFPDRTDSSMYIKIYEEVAEVIRSDGDPLEVADLFILLLDFAKRKNIGIYDAISEKLAINRGRDWQLNSNGTMSHKGSNRG